MKVILMSTTSRIALASHERARKAADKGDFKYCSSAGAVYALMNK